MPPRPLVRLVRTAAAAALAAAVLPAAASAAASDCPPQPTSKPFAPLGDLGDYFLAPGGDFEGATTWTLGPGASVRAVDKPVDFAGGRALDLAPGATASSPGLCVDPSMPHLRFGTRALDEEDRLRVEAVDVPTGQATTLDVLDGDDFRAGWWVTPEVPLAGRLDLAAGSRTVRLRLTALRGRWQSDAVYVDPFVRR